MLHGGCRVECNECGHVETFTADSQKMRKQEQDLIKRAVELADGFQLLGSTWITTLGQGGPYRVDSPGNLVGYALAAQLVRQYCARLGIRMFRYWNIDPIETIRYVVDNWSET